ncbi:MAG: 6-phosphogluconolactonase [Burkholderiales bacterium]|nr:6-phosphogluconolactonase [Burkholderiales bacterium]
MQVDILANDDAVAESAARFIAAQAAAAIAARGRFTLAVSGGRTPWQMLRALASESVDWTNVHVFQVDERVAPPGDPDRNLTHIRDSLLTRVAIPRANVHPMPVEATDLADAAARYAQTLATIAGTPPMLDLVHLGLGADGHTASLVPGDPVLEENFLDVSVTQPYLGHRRMTLTYPVLDRARCVLFVVTGSEKVGALRLLRAGDRHIPAARVTGERTTIIADAAAAG